MFDPQTVTAEVVSLLTTHIHSLHMRLLWGSDPTADPPYSMQLWQARESSPLREDITVLCRVANGDLDRASADDQRLMEIADTVQGIVEITAAPPVLTSYTIDDAYFATSIGELIAHVILWQRGDDLITATEVATILYPHAMTGDRAAQQAALARVRRAGENGSLVRYRNVKAATAAREQWLYSREAVVAGAT